jgi:DNA-binding beta-propeller fold protein YncE
VSEGVRGGLPLVAALLIGAGIASSDSQGAVFTVAPVIEPRVIRTSGEPLGVAIDGQRGRAYVADLREDTLFVFDLASGDALGYVSTGHQPSQVVHSARLAFVSNFGDATVTVVDLETARVTKRISAGGLGLAIDAKRNRVYAAAGTRIDVLDGANGAQLGTMAAPAGANVWGLAVDPEANHVYATDIANPRILVYDAESSKPLGEIAIDAPARFGIAVGSAGRLYVASYTDHDPLLSLFDGPSGRLIGRVRTNAFTRSITVDPTRGLVYTAGGPDGAVTAIDAEVRGAPSKVTVDGTAGAVAINPATSELLVVTTGGAAPPARRPATTPTVTRP